MHQSIQRARLNCMKSFNFRIFNVNWKKQFTGRWRMTWSVQEDKGMWVHSASRENQVDAEGYRVQTKPSRTTMFHFYPYNLRFINATPISCKLSIFPFAAKNYQEAGYLVLMIKGDIGNSIKTIGVTLRNLKLYGWNGTLKDL